MLVDLVQQSVLDEEYAKICICESCEKYLGTEIYLIKSGFCTVLSHVCLACKDLLEADCIIRDYPYQFISKPIVSQK